MDPLVTPAIPTQKPGEANGVAEPKCSCGQSALSLCACQLPDLLPLCSTCFLKHVITRGNHHQLPPKASQFVTSQNTYREAGLRLSKYEDVKRRLEASVEGAEMSEKLLQEAALKLISTIQTITESGLLSLKQAKQAAIRGKSRILDLMEIKLFDLVPYFPSAQEMEIFSFSLGLESVEKALEGFGKVSRSCYDMDLSDIMKQEEEAMAVTPAPPTDVTMTEPVVQVLPAPREKPETPERPHSRSKLAALISSFNLPGNKAFKCPRHKCTFGNQNSLLKHLRIKHEKFSRDMLPSDEEN